MIFVYALTLLAMIYDLVAVFRSDMKEMLIKNENVKRIAIIAGVSMFLMMFVDWNHFTGKVMVGGVIAGVMLVLYLMPKSLGGGDVKLIIALSFASPSPILFVFSILFFQGIHIWFSAFRKWLKKEKPYMSKIYIMAPSIVIGYIVSTVGLLFVM